MWFPPNLLLTNAITSPMISLNRERRTPSMPKYPISWWVALIMALLDLVARFFPDDDPPPTEPTRAHTGSTGKPTPQ
jgi:hypothetical protein